MILIIAFLILLFILWKCSSGSDSEGFVSKPTDADIKKFSDSVLQNNQIFHGGTFYEAREKMPWIDAVTFEDLRILHKNNNLNGTSLREVFI